MNGHRSIVNDIHNQQIVYQNFNQIDHSGNSIKVRNLEKIYHHTNNSTLSTSFRRQREEYWARELGTATPYGWNDKINTVGKLSSPICSSVNVTSNY